MLSSEKSIRGLRRERGRRDDGARTMKIIVFSFSIKRSMALDRNGPAPCKRCFYCRAGSRRAHSYENHIFMDYGISHIQHITGINGIASRRTRFSAIPRRAMLADEAEDNWEENRVKSPSNSIRTVDPSRRRTFQNSKYPGVSAQLFAILT